MRDFSLARGAYGSADHILERGKYVSLYRENGWSWRDISSALECSVGSCRYALEAWEGSDWKPEDDNQELRVLSSDAFKAP